MQIAVIGAGAIGRTLSQRLAGSGQTVTVGVRSPQSAPRAEIDPRVQIATVEEAIATADAVIVAIPGGQIPGFAREHGGRVAGKVVIDATNDIAGGTGGSLNHLDAWAEAARRCGGRPRLLLARLGELRRPGLRRHHRDALLVRPRRLRRGTRSRRSSARSGSIRSGSATWVPPGRSTASPGSGSSWHSARGWAGGSPSGCCGTRAEASTGAALRPIQSTGSSPTGAACAPTSTSLPVGIVARLARARTHIDGALEAVFEGHGLSAPGFAVLVTLAGRLGPAGVPQRTLMDELGLTSGTISVRIDRLAEDGLVERRPDPGDGRNSLIVLTERGRLVFERVVPAHLENERRLLVALADDERAVLAGLLRKLLVEYEGSLPQAGADVRLGLTLSPAHVTIAMRRAVGLPAVAGLLVRDVDETSPAREILQPGDVLERAGVRFLTSVAGPVRRDCRRGARGPPRPARRARARAAGRAGAARKAAPGAASSGLEQLSQAAGSAPRLTSGRRMIAYRPCGLSVRKIRRRTDAVTHPLGR